VKTILPVPGGRFGHQAGAGRAGALMWNFRSISFGPR
jgi:hypothetical protein